VRTFNNMLKLLRELLGVDRSHPMLAARSAVGTEQAAALVHVSQTAATFGRCR